MSSTRLATAADVPPNSCSICLASPSSEPGWHGDGLLICEPCCRGTRSLVQRADTACLAEVWFVGRALIEARMERSESEDVAATGAALALAYSEIGLDVTARVEALVAVRRGDEATWRRLIGVLLGDRVAKPAFKDALRGALESWPTS